MIEKKLRAFFLSVTNKKNSHMHTRDSRRCEAIPKITGAKVLVSVNVFSEWKEFLRRIGAKSMRIR